ncbi:MAG: AraC family transcriptional regulator [Reichenbachiella sp.]
MHNLIHIANDFGWFIGSFDNNHQHRHYAIQLSIPIDGILSINTSSTTLETVSPILIKSNIIHRLVSKGQHIVILINPASTIGHYWNSLINDEVSVLDQKPAAALQAIVNDRALLSENPSEFSKQLNELLMSYDCFCDSFIHQGDDRINSALDYLQNHYNRVVPLEEIAEFSNISTSRFLHLFKEHTGITYRRSQLWTKLNKAIPLLENQSLTQTAHETGFADSAHFSRTFRENFGFSPHRFLKVSQFVQV